MANLFRNMMFRSQQQIRFLPRFAQSIPETPATNPTPSGNNIQSGEVEEPTSKGTPKQPAKKVSTKWLPKNDNSQSLVIKFTKETQPKPKIKQESISRKFKKLTEKTINTTRDEQGNIIYTKMGNNDIRISQIMAELTSQKGKRLMLLEGKRLVKEALETGCTLEYILFSRVSDLEYFEPLLPKQGRLYKMPYKEMQAWSNLTTNPGIMGIFKIPSTDLFKPKEAIPLTIICDNVREPNNLGAILRTSSGVGCEEIVLTKGCVNVWDTKVLRTACGAHFRVRILKNVNFEDIKSEIPSGANVFIADNNIITVKNESEESVQNLVASLPVLPYFSVNFRSSSHIVLIIGGETEGISSESYKLAKEFNGVRLNVPLSNGVESLNTGTALGIIAFEIKKQLSSEDVIKK